jgi:hypothetical protein
MIHWLVCGNIWEKSKMVISEETLRELLMDAWCDGRDAGNIEISEREWNSNRSLKFISNQVNSLSKNNDSSVIKKDVTMTINETAALYGQEVQYEYQDCLDENVWHPFRAIVDHELLQLMAKCEIRNVIRLR